MKALKVTSRDLSRMAGGGAHIDDAIGKQYVTLRNACAKGTVLIDGELYVRYASVTVPKNIKCNRLQLLADHIERMHAGVAGRFVDPVHQARTSNITQLTATIAMSDNEYARYMLGMDPDAPALKCDHAVEVVLSLREEAARCRN